MDALVDDELLLIFAYLNEASKVRLERVSRRWLFLLRKSWRSIRRLSLHTFLYRNPRFAGPLGYDLILRDAAVDSLLRRIGHNLQHLSFGLDFDLLNGQVPTLSDFGNKYSLTCELLNSISIHCPRLRRLNLSSHIFPSVNFLRKLLNSLRLPQMEQLVLDFCRLDTNSELEGSEGSKILRKGLEGMSSLQRLSMRSRGSWLGYLIIDEDFLCFLPPSLVVLYVCAGQSLRLTQLHFTKRLPHLRELDIEKSGVRCLSPLVKACPGLRGLNVSFCQNLRDFRPIALLRSLRCLRTSGNREWLDNAALEAIVGGCGELEELWLDCCARLSGSECLSHEGLKSVSRLVGLRVLSVTGVLGMEDGALSEICLGCPVLESLAVKGCRKLSGRALLRGLSALPHLRQLFVSLVPDFDEAIFSELLVACPYLCYVEALDCPIRLSARREGRGL